MSDAAVYIVDDDEAIRDSLSWLFRSRKIAAKVFPSAEAFLAECSQAMRGCLVLDIRMEGMSGIELFDRLAALGCELPVLFLTGHGEVALAVAALKNGAFDFVEKPFNDNELVNRVVQAMHQDDARWRERESRSNVTARVAQLTPREREVMDRILAGKYNKEIAHELDIAMRTVEVHRARIFEKMGVRSAVELAQLLARKP